MAKAKNSSSKCEICPKLAEEIEKLNDIIQKLSIENTKMSIALKDNGLSEEISQVSDQEAICVEQIRKLRELSTTTLFSQEDAKVLDIIHTNLLRARNGKLEKNAGKGAKKLTTQELLEITKKIN